MNLPVAHSDPNIAAFPASLGADLDRLLEPVRVLPVVSVSGPGQAVDLALALRAGGLRAIEITLRTPGALGAIEAVSVSIPEMVVFVGTVTSPAQWRSAANAGAYCAVSPGLTPSLTAFAAEATIPLLPGVATASEAMTARDAGFRTLKLFPAAVLGGPRLLRALGGPLGDLRFCPTGGIDAATYNDYLSLANVLCVGGSWMVPRASLEAGDWADIERRARAVAS